MTSTVLNTLTQQTMQPDTSAKRKYGKTKRKIPVIYVPQLCDEAIDYYSSVPEIKEKIFNSLIEGIAEAKRYGFRDVKIAKIAGKQEYVVLPLESCKGALEKAILFFSSPEIENFERCLECRNLLTEIL